MESLPHKRIKILAVCQYYYPEIFQITPICEQLAADGYDVTVLTGLPNYPLGIVPEEYKKGHRDEMINGVHVIRCYEIGRKKGAVNLAINYISFCISSLLKVRRLEKDYDLVFLYQLSPVFMGFPALYYSQKNKTPLLLYCCDLWPESLKMYIKGEKNPIFAISRVLSKKIYSSATRIACQSSTFISYLNRIHHIEPTKASYLPAFADESYLDMNFSKENETIDFVFLGNLGIAQNLIDVLKAVKSIKELPNYMVHFIGDGSMLEKMKEFVKENDMEHIVRFYGRRPLSEMPKYYSLADVCIVSLRADNETGLTLPSKVQGYMAAGKPVLGMINGATQEVIEDADCGICVEAGDIKGFADAMKRMIQNKDDLESYGINARKYFRNNFRKEQFIGRLEKEINNLVAN